ncbi:952_t:CDS:2 [Entrophospora sp. SA101]|nr:8643_t:CDS:2 [Entrophospora sp. SA101]CAJ0903360.1 952_t:CDS:2 [Entrophospora sp. SA101]
MEIERVLNDVCGCLERLDLASIDSNNPIASGIVDIAEGVDKVVDELSEETKHILKEVELSKLDFSEKTGPEFDPALATPITFLQDEINLSACRILLMTYDLLEGL